MVAPRRAGRSRFTLFVLVLTAITLVTLDSRNFGPLERLEDGIAAVLSPLRGVGDTVFSPIGDAWSGITDRDELIAENEDLRAEIAELRTQTIEDRGAAEDLAALRAQLGLEETISYPLVVAEVVAGSISNFDGHVIEIDRGTADGIVDAMPVVSEGGGLIGRVEDAGRRRSRVRLFSDPSFSVGALIVGADTVAIVSGAGTGEPLEVGQGSVRLDVDVQVGDVLVTAGSDLYPPGLPIGTVSEVIVDQGSLEKRLLVEPASSSSRLRFVTVVLYDGTVDDPDGSGSGSPDDEDGG